MNIILGATGRVGSVIAHHLINHNEPVRAVIRNPKKASPLEEQGIDVRIADYTDTEALRQAVQGGESIFLLTPEDPTSEDVLGDTQTLLNNYRAAVEASSITRIVGLSSIGAQHAQGTGNLLMSHMLEQTFADLDVPQVFVRPAYYYSNWEIYLGAAQSQGILPSFYPTDLQIPMISPADVGHFVGEIIQKGIQESSIIELTGPQTYSTNDVANTMSPLMDRPVEAQQIPRSQWEPTLRKTGFTEDATAHLVAMTEALISGKAQPEAKGKNPRVLTTSLQHYLEEKI